MKRIVRSLVVAFIFAPVFASEPSINLRSGDVWVNFKGKEINVTNTGGKIRAIEISPSGRYAAANKQIGEYEGHDDSLQEGEHAPMEPIYSVLIIDLKNRKVLSELRAPQELTHPDNWKSNEDKYQFGEGGALDVYAVHEYDPITNKVRQLTFNNESGQYE